MKLAHFAMVAIGLVAVIFGNCVTSDHDPFFGYDGDWVAEQGFSFSSSRYGYWIETSSTSSSKSSSSMSSSQNVPKLQPEMVYIPQKNSVPIGGGSTTPEHVVARISSFYIGKFEVTYKLWTNVAQWANQNGYSIGSAVCGSYTNDPNHPATYFSWNAAFVWCNALSERDGLKPVYYTTSALDVVYKGGYVSLGKNWPPVSDCVDWTANGYRLPTEAEWEYAARRKMDGSMTDANKPAGYTGTHTAYSDTDSKTLLEWGPYMVYAGNSKNSTSRVGTKLPNAMGLYDMSGNVWELCWDFYGSYTTSSPYTDSDTRGPYKTYADGFTSRVIRGGGYNSIFNWYTGWISLNGSCATSIRDDFRMDSVACWFVGFRLARTRL